MSIFVEKPNQRIPWPWNGDPDVRITVTVKRSVTDKLLAKLHRTRPPWITEDGTLRAFPKVRVPREERARCAWCRFPFTRQFKSTHACPECDFRNVRGVLSNFEIYRRMAKDERDFSTRRPGERDEAEE